jgi:hypothetical protein
MSGVKQVIAIHQDETALLDGGQTETAPLAGSGSDVVRAMRRRLPDERRAVTHHFSIAGQDAYLTVGVYEDGLPGEIFVRMAKEGSTVSGLMDAFATVVSLALQHGVPLSVLCGKLSHMRFEPSGWSGNPKIGFAKSNRIEAARRKPNQWPPGDFSHCACSRLHNDRLVEGTPALLPHRREAGRRVVRDGLTDDQTTPSLPELAGLLSSHEHTLIQIAAGDRALLPLL